jgi:hypothetical protein
MEQAGWRRVELDGAILLFERRRGTHVLLDGPELAHCRQRAPRVIQMAATNRCNLACHFCSRDQSVDSSWTADEVFAWLAELAGAGVLEVAFGGGEPWLLPGFDALVTRLHDRTPLAVSVTTNGLALTPARLARVAGKLAQVRLSLYDDNDWAARVALLARSGQAFGVNLLVTPARLPQLERWICELAALGCADVLLLSYNGDDASMHLQDHEQRALGVRLAPLARALEGRVRLKLDVCWGERLEALPRFGVVEGCGAGRDFVVLTSDRRLMPCSFHQVSVPVASPAELLAVWRDQRERLASAAVQPGCARTPGYGLRVVA